MKCQVLLLYLFPRCWEIIHWPELRCLFLTLQEPAVFLPGVEDSASLLQIFKSWDMGTALWVPLALDQTLEVHIVVKEPSQFTSSYWSEAKVQGKFF